MQIIRDSQFVDPSDRRAAAAIGNFDGVHLGHQSVIDLTRHAAQKAKVPLGVMTFEPHPRQYFAAQSPAFRLMNAASRANRLEKLGVEKLYELPFNTALAALSAEEFASQVIAKQLGLTHVVIGEDFCFGKGRNGNAEDMIRFGQEYGFTTIIAPMLKLDAGGVEISSTAIRQALTDGRPRDAALMLGHLHRIDGPVIRGEQRGRDLGFPTANLSISGLHPPKFGVYAVEIDVLDGPHSGSYQGAASIGVRPMFGENTANCETYILDFKGDLYGCEVSVALVEYLRPELKFDNLKALINQITADCAQVREILNG